jgi:transposase
MDLQRLPEGLEINDRDWEQTPMPVRQVILQLSETLTGLKQRIQELEARLGQNSQNSSRPPSSDAPRQRAKRKKSKGQGKPGARKGHKGCQRELLTPTKVVSVPPKPCECGGQEFCEQRPYHTHQHV